MTQKSNKYVELLELKGLLRVKKITYRTLAAGTKMRVATLNNKINGHSVFDTDEVEKICNYVGIASGDISIYFFPRLLRNATN